MTMSYEIFRLDSAILSPILSLICLGLYVYAIIKDITNGDIVWYLVDFLLPPVGVAHGIYLLFGG